MSNFNFEPFQVLNMLHNSPRGGGGNTFLLPVSNLEALVNGDEEFPSPSEFASSDAAKYYQGLFVGSIILLVFLLIWLCCLPCACCLKSCGGTNHNGIKSIFFYGGMGISILGFFISIRGANLISDGSLNGVGGVEDMSAELASSSNIIDDILVLLPTADQGLQEVATACQSFFDVTADLPNLTDFSTFLLEPQEIIESTFPQLDSIAEDIEPTLDEIVSVYSAITSVIIIFEVVFTVSTLISMLYNSNRIDGNKCFAAQINTCVNNVGCCLVFSCGPLFVIGLLIVTAFLGPIATLGADTCVPGGASDTALSIFNEAIGSNNDLCLFTDFDNLSELEQVGSFLCHYTQCRGVNLAFELAGVTEVGGVFVSDLVEELNDLLLENIDDLANLFGVNETEEAITCINTTLDVAEPLIQDVFTVVDNAFSLFSCDNLTPLFLAITDDSGCNGVIAGMGVIYVTWIMGAIGLMVGMTAYAMIDFSVQADREKFVFDADVVEEAQLAEKAEYVEPDFKDVQF